MKRKARGLQARPPRTPARHSRRSCSEPHEASSNRDPMELGEWEETRGVVTKLERSPMGLLVTLQPEPPEVSFHLRTAASAPCYLPASSSGLSSRPSARPRECAFAASTAPVVVYLFGLARLPSAFLHGVDCGLGLGVGYLALQLGHRDRLVFEGLLEPRQPSLNRPDALREGLRLCLARGRR